MKIHVSKKKLLSQGITGFLEWILSFFMILFTGGIWLITDSSIVLKYNSFIRLGIYVLFFIWIILSVKKVKYVSEIYVKWIFLCIFCLILTLFSSWNYLQYSLMRFYFPILIGILIGIFISADVFWRLLDKFIFIMILIAAISLVFWIFGTMLHILIPFGSISFQWSGIKRAQSYYGIYFEPLWQAVKIFGINSIRNCAIFAEPPMYGFLLCMAYSFYRMKLKQKNWIRLIFTITILTTMGTTAIIYLLVFEIIAFGLNKNSSNMMQLIKFFAFICVCIVAGLVIYSLVADKLATGSGSVRSDHLRVSLELFKTTFPFGCGIGNFTEFDRLAFYKQGLSIGLPSLFAQGGLGSVIVFLFPFIYLIITSIKTKQWKLIAFTIAFIWTSVCTTVQLNSPLSWIIIFYAARGADGFLPNNNAREIK